MDIPRFRGSAAHQSPSDYPPEWLDTKASLENYNGQPTSAGQAVPVMGMADNFISDQEPEIPQGFLGSQEHRYEDFQQVGSRGTEGEYPGFSSYIHDAHLQNHIGFENYYGNDGAAFSFNLDREVHMPRVPSVGSFGHFEPLPLHSEHNPYYPVGRNATDLPANAVSSELSGEILVQPRADQQVLSHCNELGLSATEPTSDCPPTNGFLSPPRISRPPASSPSDTGSELGRIPEGSGSLGGESWTREFIWDSKTGNEVQAKGVKHRSEEEKENNKRLRARGGACEMCRRRHRRCNHRSEEPLEAAKIRQSHSFRTSPRNPATRNIESGNVTPSLPCQIPSRQLDIREIDELRNTGFQFASVQYPLQSQSLEGKICRKCPLPRKENFPKTNTMPCCSNINIGGSSEGKITWVPILARTLLIS